MSPLVMKLTVTIVLGFIGYFLVLKKFLFPWLNGLLENRQRDITAAFDQLEQQRADLAALKAEYQAHLSGFAAETAALQAKAEADGQRIAEEIRNDAEQRHTDLLAKGRTDIEREVQKARITLRDDAVNAAMTTARQVIDEKLDAALHRALIDKYIEELDRVR